MVLRGLCHRNAIKKLDGNIDDTVYGMGNHQLNLLKYEEGWFLSKNLFLIISFFLHKFSTK